MTVDQMSTAELQGRLIYAIIVAGKTADFADQKTRSFLERASELSGLEDSEPFAMIRALVERGLLLKAMRDVKVGNYSKMERALTQLSSAEIDLRTCSPQVLEKIDGIGQKTSRFFITWVRPDEIYAVLDVHVLRWLRENGHPDAPRHTPPPREYVHWERVFIAEAHKRGKSPRQFDEVVWSKGAGRDGESDSDGD